MVVGDLGLALATIFASVFMFDLAERLAPLLGPLAPPEPGLWSTLFGGTVALMWAATWGTGGWLRRRYGRCERRGDLLVFFPPMMLNQGFVVRRDDVTDWEVGPHGVRVRALRHARPRRSRPERRGPVAELLTPLLVPTTDPAEVDRVVAFLQHRD